ncbi:MAG: PHP domain-containing protein [Oscillospiraceae bacterium]
MSAIDLHMHSSYSGDGEYTIRQLIDLCARQKIKLASITDHNSVKSVAEALEYGKTPVSACCPELNWTARIRGKIFTC